MGKKKSEKIVISGLTEQGKVFRPSNWAERMSGTMATFKNRRIYYSPLLQPSVNHEGYKCVILDPKLKESSPQVYETILEFAKSKSDIGAIGCKLIDGSGQFLPESKRNVPVVKVALQKMFGNGKNYYANHINQNEIGKVEVLVGAFMFMKQSV